MSGWQPAWVKWDSGLVAWRVCFKELLPSANQALSRTNVYLRQSVLGQLASQSAPNWSGLIPKGNLPRQAVAQLSPLSGTPCKGLRGEPLSGYHARASVEALVWPSGGAVAQAIALPSTSRTKGPHRLAAEPGAPRVRRLREKEARAPVPCPHHPTHLQRSSRRWQVWLDWVPTAWDRWGG